MQNLSKDAKISRVSNAVAAGVTTVTSDAIDMQGFESVTFVVAFGAIVAGAVTSVKVQQSSDDGASDAYADLEATSVTVADDDDNGLVYIEVVRPRERYLKCLVLRATQNSTVDGIIAVQTCPRELPVTHATGVEGETHVSPAEGTA